ncbi:hypothetical protein NKH77_17055 [Streptomyces sp. M19]
MLRTRAFCGRGGLESLETRVDFPRRLRAAVGVAMQKLGDE